MISPAEIGTCFENDKKRSRPDKMGNNSLVENITDLVRTSGIDAFGFAEASEFSGYLLDRHPRRDPRLTVPNAKSILVAGIYIGAVTMPEWGNPWYGRTSRLYLSGFFLDVVKPLEPIAAFLENEGYRAVICNGSKEGGSILPLKLAAVRAGLGWQGKHSLLISKKYGTFLALGGIITDAVLENSAREEPNRCRDCSACQEACPVGALTRPHVLNVDRCMSNRLSEENLPPNIRTAMENRIADCEICQDACPWNRKHLANPLETGMSAHFRQTIDDWGDTFYLSNLARLSERQYKERFGHLNTGIPYRLFRRNVLIALERAENISVASER